MELLIGRQSVRKYLGQPVEKEKVDRCLDAARIAPSASNSQPWKFIVVDDQQLKDQVARFTFSKLLRFNSFTLQAPVIIVIVMEKPKVITQIGGAIKKKEFPLIDLGIAAEHFCLQATEEGLGTCMIGWFNQKGIKKLLNIPGNKTIGLLITVGYPPKDYSRRPKIRKERERVISYNTYH